AVQSYRRRPGLTSLVVVVLALGVGANVSMFSVVRAALMHEVPYPQPDRLVRIWKTLPTARPQPLTSAEYSAVHDRVQGLRQIAGCTSTAGILRVGDDPREVTLTKVTSGFFEVFGVAAAQGRVLNGSDVESGVPA